MSPPIGHCHVMSPLIRTKNVDDCNAEFRDAQDCLCNKNMFLLGFNLRDLVTPRKGKHSFDCLVSWCLTAAFY